MTEEDSPKLREERRAIGQVLSTVDPFSEDDDREDAPDSLVVTGWVVIVEHMDGTGARWLSHFSGDANGDRGLPSWAVQGFCHDVLAREGAKT